MANHFVVSGFIKNIKIADSGQPGKAPSAVVLVQYGRERQRTGKRVEFVNAVMVRIPGARLEKVRARLVEGEYVTLVGHHQGTLKYLMTEGYYSTEMVADRVEFDEFEDETPAEHVE